MSNATAQRGQHKTGLCKRWEEEQLKAILRHWGLPETLVKDDGLENDFSISMAIEFNCGDDRRGFVTVFTDDPENCEVDIPIEKFLPFAVKAKRTKKGKAA
jgi:hypothetical protein